MKKSINKLYNKNIMKKNNIVWSSEAGDLRNKKKKKQDEDFNVKDLNLKIRRLTSGKGRTVIEIKGLPQNQKWCKSLAKDLKKALGTAGTYKNGKIEIHGEQIERLGELLTKKGIKWKKTGG
ncbi:MAG: translation initiation factor [Candidatus Muiribacteriota bacterium]